MRFCYRSRRNRQRILRKKVTALLDYADFTYKGLKPSEHGGTESDHVKALREMGADIPDDTVDMPQAMAYLWDLHREIRFSLIPSNTDGVKTNLLSPRESLTLESVIKYAEYTGLNLNKAEISAIMSLDSIYNRYCA